MQWSVRALSSCAAGPVKLESADYVTTRKRPGGCVRNIRKPANVFSITNIAYEPRKVVVTMLDIAEASRVALKVLKGQTRCFLVASSRNPWGSKVEWNGPWCDQSDEWSAHPEIAADLAIDHKADGLFWMDLCLIYIYLRMSLLNAKKEEKNTRRRVARKHSCKITSAYVFGIGALRREQYSYCSLQYWIVHEDHIVGLCSKDIDMICHDMTGHEVT